MVNETGRNMITSVTVSYKTDNNALDTQFERDVVKFIKKYGAFIRVKGYRFDTHSYWLMFGNEPFVAGKESGDNVLVKNGRETGTVIDAFTDLGIIMSAESVRAILDGTKTMTRRVIIPQPQPVTVHPDCTPWISQLSDIHWSIYWVTPKGNGGLYKERDNNSPFKCPYQIGQTLWVKEAWSQDSRGGTLPNGEDMVYYRADMRPDTWQGFWKSPWFMPRWASRIDLTVTNRRAERVQEITEEDAFAEGICGGDWLGDPVGEYAKLWDKLNAKRGYPFDSNPMVWVVEFERVKP
jgi:hypothetical protein